MNVRLGCLFEPPTEEDREALRDVAAELTKDPGSVRVFADTEPGWLVADFTMPTEAQSRAVPRIYQLLRLYVQRRQDAWIAFPPTEAERARAARKAARRRARRQQLSEDDGPGVRGL